MIRAAVLGGEDIQVLAAGTRNPHEPLVGTGRYALVVLACSDPKRAGSTLPFSGAVDGERIPAALGDLVTSEQDAHLLAVVHGVEYDLRGGASGREWGFHEERGQRGIFVRNFDALDVRVAPLEPRMVALKGLAADLAFLLARDDEALPREVVHAGAQVAVARAERSPLGGGRVGRTLEPSRHRAPLLAPGVGLALAGFQPFADFVDLAERDRAVGRHPLRDEGRVRPGEIAGELLDPGAPGRHDPILAIQSGCPSP